VPEHLTPTDGPQESRMTVIYHLEALVSAAVLVRSTC